MTTKNSILDELRATRERLLAESGGTLSGLVARLQKEQAASDRPQHKRKMTNQCTEDTKHGELRTDNLSSPPSNR